MVIYILLIKGIYIYPFYIGRGDSNAIKANKHLMHQVKQ